MQLLVFCSFVDKKSFSGNVIPVLVKGHSFFQRLFICYAAVQKEQPQSSEMHRSKFTKAKENNSVRKGKN